MAVTDLLGRDIVGVGSITTDPTTGNEEIQALASLFNSPTFVPTEHALAQDLATRVRNLLSTSDSFNISDLMSLASISFGEPVNDLILIGGPRHNEVVQILTSEATSSPTFSSDFLANDPVPALFGRYITLDTGMGDLTVQFNTDPDGRELIPDGPVITLEINADVVPRIRSYPQVGPDSISWYAYSAIIGRRNIAGQSLLWIAGTRDIGTRAAILALAEWKKFQTLSQSNSVFVQTFLPNNGNYGPNIEPRFICTRICEQLFLPSFRF